MVSLNTVVFFNKLVIADKDLQTRANMEEDDINGCVLV